MAGSGYVDLMKASIAHGIRPSSLILGKDSRKPWNATDILLAKCYQRFLDEICQQCNAPKYICHSSDHRIRFKLMRDECESAAVAEHEQKRMVEAKEDVSGMKVYAEPYLSPEAVEAGFEMSDFRRPYLIERAKRMGILPESYPIPEP